MNWIVFSYSLPSQSSTPRVTLWRRLQRLGALSPTGSVYLLPAADECVEAFQWLAHEVQQAGGEALVMQVSGFEGLTDAELVDLFNEARRVEYEELHSQLTELEQRINDNSSLNTLRRHYEKFQQQYAEIARIDYFHCPPGVAVAARLRRFAKRLASNEAAATQIEAADISAFSGRQWVTRPRPHVDRLACAWLIRRFIDPYAEIRYGLAAVPDEVAFDMSAGRFGHVGNLCTFEVMLRAFGLTQPALETMAEVVHEIDLRDGRYIHPETAGIDAVLKGWLQLNLDDIQLEQRGIALFEGLYQALSAAATPAS